jgi:hypothetical protein
VPITQIQFPSRRRPPNIHWLINLLYWCYDNQV